jgi:hypothetical protein
MPIRDDRRRKAPSAIAARSLPALLVLAAVTIAKPSQTVPAEHRSSAGRRPTAVRRPSTEDDR